MYFGEHPLSKKENPLTWWKKNAAHYPTLAKLAKSLLCIPATSTPSERLFSAAGNIASKKGASLSPEHVDMLTIPSLQSHASLKTCVYTARDIRRCSQVILHSYKFLPPECQKNVKRRRWLWLHKFKKVFMFFITYFYFMYNLFLILGTDLIIVFIRAVS